MTKKAKKTYQRLNIFKKLNIFRKMTKDRLVNIFFPSKHNLSTRVVLNNYIKNRLEFPPNPEKLYVLCPPWHLGGAATYFLRRKVRRSNNAFLTYDINPDVVSPDYRATAKYLTEINKIILNDIIRYDQIYKFKEIIIIGLSIGSLYAAAVANKLPSMKRLVMVIPGDSLAGSVFDSVSTKDLRHVFRKNKITYKELESHWKDFNTTSNISNLKGKEVHLYLSKSDEVIKYKYGKKLENSLKKVGANLTVFKNKNHGHYGTVIKFLLYPRKSL